MTLVRPALRGDDGHRHRRSAARALHAARQRARCSPAKSGCQESDRISRMADLNTAQLQADTSEFGPAERAAELEHARRQAERYRLEFVDMDTFGSIRELFRSIPADLMLRYGFVPCRRDSGRSSSSRTRLTFR